ncbi:melanophilin-like isoform X2 [Rhincodon typus]|uniref:melanophilin-like isoform X2 n=1 Tax=Rhincodon typus TaxID=259920 RepID=UPI0020306AC8|nr:melanophilin-like isoform X2 [Rhincodon typus]
MARKLDLSKLTEDEAQHVLHVVQRDLNLRKTEEDRLGELRTKVEEETTKRKFLTKQAKFNEGHCIHCLEPFQYLVNSKRQCLDCSLYTCKSCSKFNKKEFGWVCDSCRITRIVNTGSLDWFYNHVRSRFKSFGSAKVMQSLCRRLQSGEKHSLRNLDTRYERDGFDNVSDGFLHGEYNTQMMAEVIEEDENAVDNEEAHRYSVLRRNKRLLSVHPTDFDVDSEYSAQSRRQSFQLPSPHYDGSGLQSFSECPFTGNSTAEEGSRRESYIGEAELTSVFRNILQEKGQKLMPDSVLSTEVRLEINKRRKSLDKSSKSDEVVHHEYRLPRTRSVPGMWTSLREAEAQHSVPYHKHGAQYYADVDSSDNDEAPELPVYQRHFVRRRSRSSSQEHLVSGGSQSSANTGGAPASSLVDSEASGFDLTDADVEEEKLKKKLGELASNISDKGPSSEEEDVKRKTERPQELTSSGEDPHTEALKRSSAVALCDITTKTLRIINATEKALHDFAEVDGAVNEPLRNPSLHLKASEKDLSVSEADEAYRKLEENVSDIENRIAALSTTGMNVSTEDKPKRKQDGQAMMMHQPPCQKSSIPTGNKESKTGKSESFERNILNRGSLTQRNPTNKSRRLDRVFGKPVMTKQP